MKFGLLFVFGFDGSRPGYVTLNDRPNLTFDSLPHAAYPCVYYSALHFSKPDWLLNLIGY